MTVLKYYISDAQIRLHKIIQNLLMIRNVLIKLTLKLKIKIILLHEKQKRNLNCKIN